MRPILTPDGPFLQRKLHSPAEGREVEILVTGELIDWLLAFARDSSYYMDP